MPDSNPDANADVLARLQAAADPLGGAGSNEELLAQLNREPDPDPMADVEYTGDLEEDSKRELTAVQQGFRDRAKREQERFELATDSEYWAVLCFRTRVDKELFLRRANLMAVGDKYLDGYAVAKLLGVSMEDNTTDPETTDPED